MSVFLIGVRQLGVCSRKAKCSDIRLCVCLLFVFVVNVLRISVLPALFAEKMKLF